MGVQGGSDGGAEGVDGFLGDGEFFFTVLEFEGEAAAGLTFLFALPDRFVEPVALAGVRRIECGVAQSVPFFWLSAFGGVGSPEDETKSTVTQVPEDVLLGGKMVDNGQ